jgi:hypothetical protein
MKRWNPQPGHIVSFKHRGFLLTSKKPKLPTIHRIRPDLTWEDVVAHWHDPKQQPRKGILLLSIDPFVMISQKDFRNGDHSNGGRQRDIGGILRIAGTSSNRLHRIWAFLIQPMSLHGAMSPRHRLLQEG